MSQDDIYIYRTQEPHTAIPNWILTSTNLSLGARLLACVMIAHQARPIHPTVTELSETLNVDRRSVWRWLDEMKAAGILTVRRLGRRNFYVIRRRTTYNPITDPAITDPAITDPAITDPAITDHFVHVHPPDENNCLTQQDALERLNFENAISDRPGGGGGGESFIEIDSPSPSPRRGKVAHLCETRLGRFLAASGIGAAKEFDNPELDADHWIAWFQAQRREGVSHNRIVHLMRLGAPLEWLPPVHLLSDDLDNLPDPQLSDTVPDDLDHSLRRIRQLAQDVIKDNKHAKLSIDQAYALAERMLHHE